jgi:hypothetical protein
MWEIPRRKDGGLERWEQLSPSSCSLIVVSYFTDMFYLRDAFDLARSCQALGVRFVIEQVRNLRTWSRNTNHKPTFLLRMSNRFPDEPLLWLDADARVRSLPGLLETVEEPIAYHTFQGLYPLSGTVLLNPGPWRRPFLEEWLAEVTRDPGQKDQVALGKVVKRLGLRRRELPETYCWIYDTMLKKRVADPTLASPVIEHLQASRWTRESK